MPKLTPEGAAEIRALSQYPHLSHIKWGRCRGCGEYGPTNWGPEENLHIMCKPPEGEKTIVPRRKKGEPQDKRWLDLIAQFYPPK